MVQPSYPKKFNILVAALKTPSDPSRGPSGNPTVSRTGFTLQQINLENGTNRIAGPIATPVPVSALAHTASIEVASADYWDPIATPPAPLYLKEEVSLFNQYIVASEEFGSTFGSGVGPTVAIATQLATALNGYPDVDAVSVASTVYITSRRPDSTMPIQATDDMSVILGSAPFEISGFGGVLLSVGPEYRQTFFVVRPTKFQSPPISLP